MAEAKPHRGFRRLVYGAGYRIARAEERTCEEDGEEDGIEPRIAFLAYEGAHMSDGGVASLWLLISGIDSEKCFIVTSRGDGRAAAWRSEGYRVYVVRHWRDMVGAHKRLKEWLWGGVRLWWILRSESAGVVHLNDIRPAEQAWLALLSTRWRIILNVRDVKPRNGLYGIKWRVASRVVDHVLTLSAEMQRDLVNRLGVKPFVPGGAGRAIGGKYQGVVGARTGRGEGVRRRVRKAEASYIYSAVDWESLPSNREMQRPGRECRERGSVAYVGAVCEKKGQLEFLRQAVPALLEDPDCTILFLGDFRPEESPYARACQAQVRTLSKADRVKFVGSVDDVREWYESVDVTVLASKHEGLARSMIESVSCGTPMVSFDVSSAREVLESYGAGIVVPEGDYGGLVAAIRAVVGDGTLREAMGWRGVGAGRELFDVERVRARYVALCRSLLYGERDEQSFG